MALATQTINLDLRPHYNKQNTNIVYCSQYDSDLRNVVVNIADAGTAVNVSTYTIYVEGTKPDKHGFSYELTSIGGTVANNVVTFPLQLQMTAVAGITNAELVFYSDDERIGSANFILAVEQAGLADDIDVSDTDIPAYVDGAQQAAQAAEDAKDDAIDAKDLAVSAAETAQAVLDSIPQDYSDLSNDVDDLKSAFVYEEGFNHYDGTYYTDKAWSESGSATLNDATGYISTGLIPAGNTGHLRFRANQQAYIICVYDSQKNFVRKSNYGAYAVAIEQNGYVGFTFTSANFNSSTLMVAYTDETSGATTDKWNTLFPNIGYIPYSNSPTALSINYSAEILTPEAFANGMQTTGAQLSADTYTGETVVSLTGTGSTKTWKTFELPCKPMTCYLLEFYGKSSYVAFSADYTHGTMLIVEFCDKNKAIIGSKYNACVLGESRRSFHRYGAVSPIGAAYVHLRVVTRSTDTMELSNVSLKPMSGYHGRDSHGVQIDDHLGCILTAPQNTMPSFEQAKIAGYNTVICNVKFTSDNVPVVIHDTTIDATSDGTGNVSDYTYEQLLTNDFGSWFNTSYTGTKIPKLENVLAFLVANGIRPAISLHGTETDAQLQIVADLFLKYAGTNCVIKSFAFETLAYMRNVIGDGAIYGWDLSATPTEANISALKSIATNCFVETTYGNVTQESINVAHARGVGYSVYSLYDTAQIKGLTKMGIDRICMDFFSDIVVPMD